MHISSFVSLEKYLHWGCGRKDLKLQLLTCVGGAIPSIFVCAGGWSNGPDGIASLPFFEAQGERRAVVSVCVCCSSCNRMRDKKMVFHHGDDYSVWKKRILGTLAIKLDYYGMDLDFQGWLKVNKGSVKEEDCESVWNMVQGKALAILWRYIEASVIRKMGEVKTVREAFKVLDEIYERHGGVEVMVLMYKLVNLKMSKGNLEDYLGEFEGISGDMERRGHKMVEVERAMLLLCGIPEDWAFLRSQVCLKYEGGTLTMDRVKNALREHQASLALGGAKDREEKYSGGERALAAGLRCKTCNRWGHSGKCVTKCFACGEVGHVAYKCPHKQEEGESEEEEERETDIRKGKAAQMGKKREKHHTA